MNTSFNRLFAMMWMLIGFGLSAETVAQSLPAQLKPADFAYGVQIDTVGMQPVQSVVLPPEVYDHLTRDDLGDLATDEFYETLPGSGMNHEEVNELIMAARAHWFRRHSRQYSRGRPGVFRRGKCSTRC